MAAFGEQMTETVWKVVRRRRALTTVTLTWPTGPHVVDPVTGAVTQPTASATAEGLLGHYSSSEVAAYHLTAADWKLIIPVRDLAVDPNVVSTVTIGGTVWEVVDVDKGNNTGAWELQVRQVGAG